MLPLSTMMPSRLQIAACLSVEIFLVFMTVSGANSAMRDTDRNVTFDHRALVIDGERRFLISGSVHYPRSTPDMWPSLINLAKEGGLDVIETYVFWGAHEPQRGQYYFEGRYDLLHFLNVVSHSGMYVNLRIGPYICGEWNLGGFPEWLVENPGIELRTENQSFMMEMQRWTTYVVNILKANKLFYSQGGPIIMTQIENEYGHVAAAYGEPGRRYISWAAYMAQSLNVPVPWIMCVEKDAPAFIINTCNGFYCDDFTPNAPNKPKMWTENYPGWFHYWGQALQVRPLQDVAYAAARFFQTGGSYLNYYMYHGGTNFDRTAARGVTTSYDYGAPIDEYGQARQPTWDHLKNLHSAIKMCAPALAAVSGEPLTWSPLRYVEIHVYQTERDDVKDFVEAGTPPGLCAAFFSNSGLVDVVIPFMGNLYNLSAWSVSILPDCRSVAFNTMNVPAQRYSKETVKVESHGPRMWTYFADYVGIWNSSTIVTTDRPQEQFSLTRDRTDYLWYRTTFQASSQERQLQQQQLLVVQKVPSDTMQVFVNGKSPDLQPIANTSGFYQQLTLDAAGKNTIDILSVTSGHPSSGSYIEKKPGGITGSVKLYDHQGTVTDLTYSRWIQQVGLKGENLYLDSPAQFHSPAWSEPTPHPPTNHQLMWYKTLVDAPVGDTPVLLDLGSMKKGSAWINGNHLGRYWSQAQNPAGGCEESCVIVGKWQENKCVTNCGQSSQRWYHVPRAWLNEENNILVLLEEVGGDPNDVSFATQILRHMES